MCHFADERMKNAAELPLSFIETLQTEEQVVIGTLIYYCETDIY